MATDDRIAVLQHGDELWNRLHVQLDTSPDAEVYTGTGWTGGDVYAHLARWQEHTLGAVRTLSSGGVLPPAPDEDEDTINERWHAEDRSLPAGVARERCLQTRQVLLDVFLSLTPEQWERFGRRCAPDVNGEHYGEHLRGLKAAGSGS